MNAKAIKVLIIDDNRDFTKMLEEFLARKGDIQVVGVGHNGAEALELIESTRPDVMLLDIIMPHLDGIGVLEKLAATAGDKPRPKVIMLTALGQEQMTRRVIELGANYYVLKPFNLETLATRIRQLARNDATSIPLPEENNSRNMETRVSNFLHEIGIPANIRGYIYLREAIMMVADESELINGVTKILYPLVAKHHKTTPSRVERAIRHAIEVAWGRGNMEALNRIFGFTVDTKRGKPTNSEFIAMVADRLRLDKIS